VRAVISFSSAHTVAWCVVVCLLAGLVSGCAKPDRRKRPATQSIAVPARSADRPATAASAVVAELRASVHAKLDCSDCHAPSSNLGAQDLGKPSCKDSCHKQENHAYALTVHATVRGADGDVAARCEDCHGAHDVKKSEDPASRTFVRKLPFTCGKCHDNPELARSLGIKDPHAERRYLESIHGRGLVTGGLLVAPSCADCHGKSHAIFPANDPRSSVNQAQVADTCGRCHAGQRDSYQTSIHAAALEKLSQAEAAAPASAGSPKPRSAPVCSTCHTAHAIVRPGGEFRLASDQICGECHADRLERYLETYHGRAHSLGDEFVAACADCHGSHAVLPVADPKSTLSAANRLETCRQCHAGAPPNFAGYLPHADHTDRANYPGLYWAFVAMTGLVVGTFGFFGVHSLLWLSRTLIVRARNPEQFKEAKRRMRREEGARLYTRFTPVDRFCHFLVIVSFLLLVITGMPIKFHEEPWARIFFDAIGGPSVASSVHRFGAVITLSYFVIHISSLIFRIRKRSADYRDERGRIRLKRLLGLVFGPDSPMPRLQDAKDLAGHLKWFFGRGPKPRFDRFTYWEKFDYIAVFWGVTVIGLSGLVLWFPAFFTRLLPGWSINLAQLIHSDEALLAAGFIFVFHFFNSHFRPDKFPLDPVMFSGRVTEEEMRHEHPAQYDRLVAEGRLEDLAFRDEWQEWKWVFNTFGVIAILLGVALAAAIFWALL
jgi:cytochrome b subunit of formate dehydrogenase